MNIFRSNLQCNLHIQNYMSVHICTSNAQFQSVKLHHVRRKVNRLATHGRLGGGACNGRFSSINCLVIKLGLASTFLSREGVRDWTLGVCVPPFNKRYFPPSVAVSCVGISTSLPRNISFSMTYLRVFSHLYVHSFNNTDMARRWAHNGHS